jgi:hypothetical protein
VNADPFEIFHTCVYGHGQSWPDKPWPGDKSGLEVSQPRSLATLVERKIRDNRRASSGEVSLGAHREDPEIPHPHLNRAQKLKEVEDASVLQ